MRPIRFSRDIRSLTEFRANAAALLQQVRHSRRPLVLTQHGRSAAVLFAVEEYERLIVRAELLDDVALAEQQLQRGEGVEHQQAKTQVLAQLPR